MIKIQLYNGVKDTTGTSITIVAAMQTITGQSNVFPISKLRKALKEYNELQATGTATAEQLKKAELKYSNEKTNLPAVTWSGTFAKRNAKNLTQHSGLICLDIDKITDDGAFNAMWFSLTTDPHAYIVFRSPSGNGIKVIFKIAPDADQHKAHFLAIEKYLLEKYNIAIDASGKDVNRLCFLSSDNNLFHSEKSIVFELPAAPIAETILPTPAKEFTPAEQKKLSKITPAEKEALKVNGQEVNDIYESTCKVITYTDGSRNNFIFKYACNCNRVGISQYDCLQFIISIATDKPTAEVEASVKSAYNANIAEHGKYKRQEQKSKLHINVADTHTAKIGNNKTGSNKKPATDELPKFWIEHKTVKGKGKSRYEQIRYELRRVDFCKFLFSQGLHLYTTGKNEGFQIVYSANGIIKPLTPQQVKHFALDWCKKHDLEDVEEMLRKGQKNYFAMNELDSLPYKEVTIATDTAQESFFYFKNCVVTVTDQGEIKTRDYDTHTDKYIWEANKVDFDFTFKEPVLYDDEAENVLPHTKMECEFAKFVSLASWNPKSEDESFFTPEIKTQRFESLCSSIGFLLDGYKHPANRKGIFAIDHKIGDQFEQNGRTGKSIIPQACNLLKKAATINGKTYDPKYQFALELITIDSQIVNFNDMRSNFDPESIFELIADDYNVNCRNTGFIHFKYKTSPKVYVSTNHIPKGQGGSYTGRMHIIEFSDYFSPTHTPYDEFGRSLFPEDDKAEMERLLNFLLWCVALFKGRGLINYPNGNYDSRKLTSEVAQEFIDFMDNAELISRNVRQEKIKLLDSFNEKIYAPQNGGKKVTAHTFTKWIKHYCKTKGLRLNPHKNGGRDNSNSVEYYTIADKDYKASQTTLL